MALESLFARGAPREELRSPPVIRRIGIADIRVVLAKGLDDFAAFRDDVVLICVIYLFVGLVLARLAFGGTVSCKIEVMLPYYLSQVISYGGNL